MSLHNEKGFADGDCRAFTDTGASKYVAGNIVDLKPKSKRVDAIHKTKEFIKSIGVYYNSLRKTHYIGSKEFEDVELNSLYLLVLESGIQITFNDFLIILNSDGIKNCNPLIDYFNSLPTWQSSNQTIKDLSESVRLKDESERDQFLKLLTKWLVGAVAGVITDNINQLCLILLGCQGAGKSTFFKHLLPVQLKEYYTEHNPKPDKDSQITIASNFLVNIDELSSFNKTDETFLKQIITQKEFDVRLAYGRRNTKIRRQSSFCGSGNQSAFLSDLTGNRRFLIFEIESVNFEALNKIDPNQIWIEALHLFKAGYQYWLDQEEITTINTHNENYMLESIEEDKILEKYTVPTDKEFHLFKTTSEIAEELSLATNPATLKKIGAILTKHKFIKKDYRKNGNTPRKCWIVQLK
jgi:predicted P-loop ATPase